MHVYSLHQIKLGDKLPVNLLQSHLDHGLTRHKKMNAHAAMVYHEAAMTKMHEFVTRYKDPAQSIDTHFDSEAKK